MAFKFVLKEKYSPQMNWKLPFLVKKQHAFPKACQSVEAISVQRKWLLTLHGWIDLCHEWIWSWIWICLMRMKSNFILKNSPDKNFRVNAIFTHWLSTFPTPVHNLSWIAGRRGSSRAKAFNMGIQNVTLELSPVVFKWPLDCLGSECRTHRSLYETWMKLQGPRLHLLQLKILLRHSASPMLRTGSLLSLPTV